jgi:hypothetical protein
VSPLRLVGVGGAAILALIGIGMHPPDGLSNRSDPPAWSTAQVTEAPIPVDDYVVDDYEPSAAASSTRTPRPPQATRPARTPARTPTATRTTDTARDTDQDDVAEPEPDEADGDGKKGGDKGGGAEPTADSGPPTVNCPSVAAALPAIPAGAAADVNRNLALLTQQITEANARLAELAENPVADRDFAENTILGPLRGNRISTIDRIVIAIGRFTERPTGLEELAACTLNP